ncbi:polyhydroxyalkanoate depolymerase [Acidovorax sp. SRB_24]|uniref:polyhydroxyalkanoate depolymerase n=1 Tax=Acidovorax sp. SRB_24 TaxID=1962700 RepID=UPI00145EB972|nr:polyhydroxyalkanoate depolymerase [Acidovorax sp. SRB_24]NMM77037.1 polyhydroxyalkanoate depolymerase [Acidovorax sp. SRB_24]
MLYALYETQRSFMEPFADFALATAKFYSSPTALLGKSPMAQRIAAGYELAYRLAKDYEKPAFGIPTVEVDGVGVAIHERVEVDKPFCELRRFKRFSDDPATLTKLKGQPVVLVVAPLSGHYATLLRDTVRTMLKDHKVYITDWKNARLVPLSEGAFHLDDYVNYVQEFIRHLQGAYGNCHVVSVCQPTVPVMAAVSLMASRGEPTPLSMTMMGGPIDARRSPTEVNDLAVNRSYEWFENNVIYPVPRKFAGAGRRVYPGFLQYSGFVAMNPDRHATSHYDYFKNLVKGDDASAEAHRRFYDEYNAVLDMDADYYLETIHTVFQEYKLVNGTWDVRSPDGEFERVRPQDIRTTALFTVEGELDDISGSGQTHAAHGLCTGLDSTQMRHLEAKGAGHYGIFSGRRWREVVYPQVRQFILDHATPRQPAASSTAPTGAAEPAPAQAETVQTPLLAGVTAAPPALPQRGPRMARKG